MQRQVKGSDAWSRLKSKKFLTSDPAKKDFFDFLYNIPMAVNDAAD